MTGPIRPLIADPDPFVVWLSIENIADLWGCSVEEAERRMDEMEAAGLVDPDTD